MEDQETGLDDFETSRAPLIMHLVELRQRLIYCLIAFALGFFLCFFWSRDIYLIILHPFVIAGGLLAEQKTTHGKNPWDLFLILLGFKPLPPTTQHLKLVFTAPLEFFFTKVKLAGFGAIILSFPFLAWQLYRFIAPGLYARERRVFLPFLLAAPVLFGLGAALVYFTILPFILWFSLSQQIFTQDMDIALLPKVSDYLELVTKLILGFGLCFQLPIVLSLAGLAGFVSSRQLAAFRRYALFAIICVAALITPPDPLSQIFLAFPIYLLYETSIICVRLIELQRRDQDANSKSHSDSV